MEWMLMPFRRYAEFSGRSRRKEYWMFALFMFLLFFGLSIVVTVLGLGADAESGTLGLLGGTGLIVFLLLALAVLIPSVAVTVRRFHDLDKSGWFYLLNFIPYVGPIIVFVMMCLEGTRGPNRFGPDPKAAEHRGAAV